jgi:hypothetical protein
MSKISELVHQHIREELQGVYTTSFVIVEEVDHKKQRCKVSLKRDKNAILSDVPIASQFASGEGHGVVAPVKADDEGLILHTKEPLDDLTTEPGHQEIGVPKTMFRPQDAVFFPCIWNDNDEVPASEEGQYLIALPPEGSYKLLHPDGYSFEMDKEGWVRVNGSKVLTEDADISLGGKINDPGQ